MKEIKLLDPSTPCPEPAERLLSNVERRRRKRAGRPQPKGAGTAETQTEEFLQAVLDGIQDVIKIVDENYNIVYANRAAKTETRKYPVELLGEKCYRGFFQNAQRCYFCQTPETFERGKPVHISYELPTPNGQKRFVELTTFPIKNREGKVKYAIEITRDVTKQKQLEEQAKKNERLAAIGELAAGMAHEIRNPLSSIVTAANLLTADGGMDEEQATLLQVVRKEAKRLNSILTDFLSYARPRELRLAPIDLNALIGETLDMLERDRNGGGHPLRVHRHLDPAAPTVEVDADQIKQVVWNIALNGVEAMPHGGELTVSTGQENGNTLIAVADTGVGIADAEMGKIFQPFHSTKREGTGLGLAIAHHIVAMHQGEIKVESAMGKGTKMTIVLPAKRSG